jgi:hypothetical protein
MKKYKNENIDRLITLLENGIMDAEKHGNENTGEPTFKLAYEIGYLRGVIRHVVSELKYTNELT